MADQWQIRYIATRGAGVAVGAWTWAELLCACLSPYTPLRQKRPEPNTCNNRTVSSPSESGCRTVCAIRAHLSAICAHLVSGASTSDRCRCGAWCGSFPLCSCPCLGLGRRCGLACCLVCRGPLGPGFGPCWGCGTAGTRLGALIPLKPATRLKLWLAVDRKPSFVESCSFAIASALCCFSTLQMCCSWWQRSNVIDAHYLLLRTEPGVGWGCCDETFKGHRCTGERIVNVRADIRPRLKRLQRLHPDV